MNRRGAFRVALALLAPAACGGSSREAADAGEAGDSMGSSLSSASGGAASTDTGAGGVTGSEDGGSDATVGDGSGSRGGSIADSLLDAIDASASSSGSSIGSACADVDAGYSGCAPIPGAYLRPFGSPASGTVTGPDVGGALCPGGASAIVESAGASYDTAPYFLYLDYTVQAYTSPSGNLGPVTDFVFQTPAGASNGELNLYAGLGSTAPGESSSPAGQPCGSMTFTYYLPVPPGIDCDGGAPHVCPPGCWAVCNNIVGGGCTPCAPQQPSVSYIASGTSDCIGRSTTPVGSWTLSLTSVTAADAGATSGTWNAPYTPHGTLTATLVNVADDAGADTITLSVCF